MGLTESRERRRQFEGELHGRRSDEWLPRDDEDIESFRREHPNLVGLGVAGGNLTHLRTTPGNHVTPLVNGEQTYPAMLADMEQATHSISLLSYIFDDDEIGVAFLEALVRAQERGVAVRVLIDDVGAKYSKANMVARLSAAGLPAKAFLPTRLPRLPKYANMRNHRKILVVDGAVGFTGGTNIRVGHCLEKPSDFPVQCLHFRFEGPVVAQMQRAFATDWAFAAGEELSGDLWFPKLERHGDVGREASSTDPTSNSNV